MTTFASINLTCTICGTAFDSNEICSCGFASKRTDFRPNYWGFNPAEYFVHLCPNCGFCSNKESFNGKVYPDEFKEEINSLGVIKAESLGKKLERAAICEEIMNKHEIVKKNNYDMANTWIHPFWWTKNKTDMINYGEKVLSYFEKALDQNEIPQKRVIENIYLMGEINRRIGKLETAADYFDDVIAKLEGNEELKGLRELAIQQKIEPKDNL